MNILFSRDARNFWRRLFGVVALAAFVLVAGCISDSKNSGPQSADATAVDLNDEISRATKSDQCLVLFVIESGQSKADGEAQSLFERQRDAQDSRIKSVLLDISVSRNRATANRYHVTNTPMLVCLSPQGLIASRDEAPITATVVSKRLRQVAEASRELDARFDALQAAANRDPNDLQAQFALADFLVSRQNKLEAIPHLEFVAHNEKAALPLRVRAWVEVCQAHIWIGEREKGRFGARDLIATLGPKTADARAGGNLAIGRLEIIMNHPELARQKLQEAVNAAPDSEYGKQAASELTKLSPEKK